MLLSILFKEKIKINGKQLTYEDNSETIHKKEIIKHFDANTGSIFKAGASYRFIIIPVAYIKVDDVVKEVNLQSYDATYDLYQLTKPNFIVKYEYRDNYQKLRFKMLKIAMELLLIIIIKLL